MTTHRSLRPTLVLLAASFLATTATATLAQAPAHRLALELRRSGTHAGDPLVADSVTARLARHLTPQVEEMGFVVQRVHDARQAAREGNEHLAVQVEVHAVPTYVVHSARRYGKTLVTDHDDGVRAWAYFRVWRADRKKVLAEGKLGPVESRLHEAGAGRPIFDDEEAVSRLLADLAGTALFAELSRLR